MPLVLSIFLYAICACLAISKPINVTVDDRYGAWPAFRLLQNISYGQGWFDSGIDKCNGCQFLPDMTGFSSALNQTWKRATYERDKLQDEPKIATFTFNGTAVYVNIIRGPTTAGGVKGNLELLFTLDGVASRIEDDAKPFVFPQTPFFQSSLPQGEHTLTIQNGDPKGKHGSCMVFLDSIMYTTDDSLLFNADESLYPNAPRATVPSECGGKNWVVIVVAGVGGAIAGALLAVISFLISRRIKRRRSRRVSSIKSLASSDTRRSTLDAVPFLKALYTSPSSVNDRTSFIPDPTGRAQVEHGLQSKPTIRTLASTRPPTYRTRDPLAAQTSSC